MSKNLVIVESPAKVGKIQKFLGDEFTVKSSLGHIRDLNDSSLSIDVENNFAPQYIVPAEKKKVVSELKKEAKKADMVWLASDEDREGEAISWHLFETLELEKEKTKRIVFHEITKPALLHAIENPREVDMNLVNAQQARRVLDRLVGFELSPVLWRKVQPRLSAGRVQSVALRLIVDREREILRHKKEQYYKVSALFHPQAAADGVLVKANLDTKFPDIDSAREFLQRCIGADFTVASVEKKDVTRAPAAPFTTSTLQQEAYRKLNFSVSQTMSVAQSLYEKGLITYMRTDSTNLSTLAINTAKKYIVENYGAQYSKVRQYRTASKGAQEAHEAIRPTYIENTEIEGTLQEKKLYNLIWKRTVACQMSDASLIRTDVKVGFNHGSELFLLQASQIVFDGFLKLYMEGVDDQAADDEEVILPEMHVGDVMIEQGIVAETKFTSAPSRYNDATLVKKLEELGIGRPSTYAQIITTLTKGRSYITKGNKEGEKVQVTNLALRSGKITATKKTETIGAEKGRLLPQEIGIIVTDYLVGHFGKVLDYGFTADVEKDFDRIAAGESEWTATISDFYGPFHQAVKDTLDSHDYGTSASREIGVDPSDGRMIVAKNGKFGPYVQKGEGDDKVCASLGAGQLIESLTLEQALKLFTLPRTVGEYEGVPIICTKGRFGPYIKCGENNYKLPRGVDPVSVTLEQCIEIIAASASKPAKGVMKEFGDIQVVNGMYGAYLKYDGKNYKLPKGTDPESLDEEKCREIISAGAPTTPSRRFAKKK